VLTGTPPAVRWLLVSLAALGLAPFASVAHADVFSLGARNGTGTSIRLEFSQSAQGECYAWIQAAPYLSAAGTGLTQVRVARRLNEVRSVDCEDQKLGLTFFGPTVPGDPAYNASTWKQFGPSGVAISGRPVRPIGIATGSDAVDWWPSPSGGPVCISGRQTPGAGGDHSAEVSGGELSFARPEGTSSAPGGYCAAPAAVASHRRAATTWTPAAPRVVGSRPSSHRASAEPSPVLDFLQLASEGCKIVYGGTAGRCTPSLKGNFDGVTVITSDWSFGKPDLLTADPVRTQVGTPVSLQNRGAAPVPLTWSQTTTVGTTSSNATTKGWKLGVKTTSKIKVPFVGETGVETNFEWNQSDTTTTTTSTQKAETHTYGPVTVQPGQEESIDVYNEVRKGDSTFSGLAQIGSPGKSEPAITPWFPNLGISPAERQPCIGYLAGDPTVKGSFSWIDQSWIPTHPGTGYDDSPEVLFDKSARSFKVSNRPSCPGFPRYFNSSINFEGTGFASVDSRLRETPVFFCKVIATGQDCPKPPVLPAGVQKAQGRLIVGSSGPDGRRAVVTGTSQDDLMIASSTRAQRLEGMGGGDIIDGEHAGDVLIDGGSAALRAGPGAETLVQTGGSGSLIGGSGNDRLISRGGDALEEGGTSHNYLEVDRGDAQVFGGPRSNTFVVRGGNSSLVPGPGADTFELFGGHADIVEAHPDPRDQVISAISTTLPFGVDRVRLIGHRPLSLIGNGEDDLITGNAGGDYLSGGGSGASRIVAGSGRNTIVVGLYDTVSAGRGADRYVPNGDTGLVKAASLPAPPPPRGRPVLTAGRIENFSAAKGDRIVLQARRLGLEIRQLRSNFRLVQGTRPRVTGNAPTLIYYTNTHLLAYAVNGAKGYPLRPLAILRGVRRLTRSDFVIG
jgi:hypothetical protein